jgi:hypothetical protein
VNPAAAVGTPVKSSVGTPVKSSVGSAVNSAILAPVTWAAVLFSGVRFSIRYAAAVQSCILAGISTCIVPCIDTGVPSYIGISDIGDGRCVGTCRHNQQQESAGQQPSHLK